MSTMNKLFFFFNDTATTEIYPLSLHDALPISGSGLSAGSHFRGSGVRTTSPAAAGFVPAARSRSRAWSRRRSEEHTSELQSQSNLVCRLLLEKKKNDVLR